VYNQPNLIADQQAAARHNRRKAIVIGFAALFLVFSVIVGVWLSLKSRPLASEVSGLPSNPPRLPEFPWPPRSSAYTKIPAQYLLKQDKQTSLKDVGARLESAFRSGGYNQTGYYSVPGGFALVSQLEQFKANGSPSNDPYRWSEQPEIPQFFSVDYFNQLIKGKTGRYRVIVFMVSTEFFSQDAGRRVDIERARTIAIEGANALPAEFGILLFTDEYLCTALIYEFEKALPDKPAEFKENSTLLAETHLQKILPYLQR
jgi:hypothetical protein